MDKIFFVIMAGLLLSVLGLCGCVNDSNSEVFSDISFKDLSLTTRCGYDDDTFYRNAVLEASVNVSNTGVSSKTVPVEFRIDDQLIDKKQVKVNASETKQVRFTTLKDSFEQFPLEDVGLDDAGVYEVTVGLVSTNLTVNEPVFTISDVDVEWKGSDEGYKPWITLRVSNPLENRFFMGGSFAVVTGTGIYQGSVDSFEFIKGETSESGYYPFPGNAEADVTIACYEINSDRSDGSDVTLSSLRVYVGFPWLDYTGGIIGEQRF